MYAGRMIENLISRSEQLSDFPRSGRTVHEFEAQGLREIIEGPYRVIYRAGAEQVDILALIHGSQLLPPEL